MKYGHVAGHKKERKGSTDWYRKYEAENLARVEAELQAKEDAKQGPK